MFNLFRKKRKIKTPEIFYVYVLNAKGELINMKSFNNFEAAKRYEYQAAILDNRTIRTNYR